MGKDTLKTLGASNHSDEERSKKIGMKRFLIMT